MTINNTYFNRQTLVKSLKKFCNHLGINANLN